MSITMNSPLELLGLLDNNSEYQWATPDMYTAQLIHTLTLTGNEVVTLQVASIQMNRRNASPSYMAVVVPSVEQFATCNARIGEQMILKRGYKFPNGVQMLQEIARSNLREVRTEETPQAKTMTLVGYKQTTYGVGWGREIGIEGYTVDENGKRTFKSVVTDTPVNPGDIFAFEEEPVTIGEIRYTISKGMEKMQIMEA